MNKNLYIAFGVLHPTIGHQLKKLGFAFKKEAVKEFEQCRQAMITLQFAGITNDKTHDKIKAKLFVKIRSHVAKQNKPVQNPKK